MEKLKVFTAFSGYDSQCLGLERLKEYCPEFDYELVGWSEINNHAIKAHNALFPQYADMNYGDISKVNWDEVPDFDLFTYSSPCTDFSSAGKQQGGVEGSGTRSSLLWECKRCIDAKRPKYLLFENVSAILQSKFIDMFHKWITTVQSFGYDSQYKILNSRDFGIPQNRDRIFLISIRQDLNQKIYFPASTNESIHLYDILCPETEVPVYTKRTNKKLKHYMELNKDAISKLETGNYGNDEYDVIPCGMYCHASDNFNSGPMFDCSRTLKAEMIDAGIIYKKNGKWYERLLCNKELYRLMGVRDDEYEKISQAVTKTGQAKCAGNSIVVNVLFHLFRKMLIDNKEPDKNMSNVLF